MKEHSVTQNTPRKVLGLGAILLSSIYLTFLVDVYTLNTLPKRLFVFCYFVLMGHVAVFLKRRFLGRRRLGRGELFGVTAVVLMALQLFHGYFLPLTQENIVSLSALSGKDEVYREVWLTDVVIDGQTVALSQLEVENNQGWVYLGDYDDYVYYPSEGENKENYLTFRIMAKDVSLTFAQNAWSGTVNIRVNEGNDIALDLTKSGNDNTSVEQSIIATRNYATWEYLLYGSGAWVLFTFLLSFVVTIIGKNKIDVTYKQI